MITDKNIISHVKELYVMKGNYTIILIIAFCLSIMAYAANTYNFSYTTVIERPLYYIKTYGSTNITGMLNANTASMMFTVNISSNRWIQPPSSLNKSMITVLNVTFNGTIVFENGLGEGRIDIVMSSSYGGRSEWMKVYIRSIKLRVLDDKVLEAKLFAVIKASSSIMLQLPPTDVTLFTKHALEDYGITWIKPIRVIISYGSDPYTMRVEATIHFTMNKSHISVPAIYCIMSSELRGKLSTSGDIRFIAGNTTVKTELEENLEGNISRYFKCLEYYATHYLNAPGNITLMFPFTANASLTTSFNGNKSITKININISPINTSNSKILINRTEFILKSFAGILDALGTSYTSRKDNTIITATPIAMTTTLYGAAKPTQNASAIYVTANTTTIGITTSTEIENLTTISETTLTVTSNSHSIRDNIVWYVVAATSIVGIIVFLIIRHSKHK